MNKEDSVCINLYLTAKKCYNGFHPKKEQMKLKISTQPTRNFQSKELWVCNGTSNLTLCNLKPKWQNVPLLDVVCFQPSAPSSIPLVYYPPPCSTRKKKFSTNYANRERIGIRKFQIAFVRAGKNSSVT